MNILQTSGIFWVAAEPAIRLFNDEPVGAFNLTLFPFPVPLYSCDWLAIWQVKELLEGTLLRLAFIRRSVTVDGLSGVGEIMVKGVYESG